MRLPIQVLVYPMCVNEQGQSVLLLKRNAKLGSFWQGVTGALEPGESLAEAAARELFEETGFTHHAVEQTDFSYSFAVPPEFAHVYSPDVEQIDEFVFLARFEDLLEPRLSHEHVAWQWCSIEDALLLLKWPDNKRALRHCRATL